MFARPLVELVSQAMLEKYRQELLHIKVDALEHAHMEDRTKWLREASFAGTVFDPRVSFERAPVEGTRFCIAMWRTPRLTGEIGPIVTIKAGAASAKVPRFLRRSNEIVFPISCLGPSDRRRIRARSTSGALDSSRPCCPHACCRPFPGGPCPARNTHPQCVAGPETARCCATTSAERSKNKRSVLYSHNF